MRLSILVTLAVPMAASVAVPLTAIAQTAPPNPGAARQNGAIVESVGDAEDAAARSLDDTPAAPAAKGRDNRILSQNESYNLMRAAEGRVGVRVGSDMSFRVEKRAGTP